jgi:hypothetical protein
MNASLHKANDLRSRHTHPGDVSGLSEQNHDRNLYSSAAEQAGWKRGIRVRLAIDKYEFLESRGVVGLRAKEESAVLEPCPTMIDIVELRAGHPRPQTADFLDETAKTSCEVAAIANADCLLILRTQLAERLICC